MKPVTPFFLVLAAVGLIAAKQEEEKPTMKPLESEQHEGQYVVRKERAALATLRQTQSLYHVNPAGHIFQVVLRNEASTGKNGLDLSFLSDLDHLEFLITSKIPATSQGARSLLKLKRLTDLALSGPDIGDEQMAVVATIKQLRVITWGPRMSAPRGSPS